MNKGEFLERIIDLLENGMPELGQELSGKGWHRERTLCKLGHPLDGVRYSGDKTKRYCTTCNRDRKKRK